MSRNANVIQCPACGTLNAALREVCFRCGRPLRLVPALVPAEGLDPKPEMPPESPGLVPCEACKFPISSSAASCPKCGHPVTAEHLLQARAKAVVQKAQENKATKGCLICLGVIILIVIVWIVLANRPTPNQIRARKLAAQSESASRKKFAAKKPLPHLQRLVDLNRLVFQPKAAVESILGPPVSEERDLGGMISANYSISGFDSFSVDYDASGNAEAFSGGFADIPSCEFDGLVALGFETTWSNTYLSGLVTSLEDLARGVWPKFKGRADQSFGEISLIKDGWTHNIDSFWAGTHQAVLESGI